MATFHSRVLGPLDPGLSRRVKADELAGLVVEGLARRRIELVFVDEAGLYSIAALRGLVAIRDMAVKKDRRLTLVWIGMDDLPITLEANPQIRGRVQEWCLFEAYGLNDTIALVTKITDLWASADTSDSEVRRQLGFVHSLNGGVPGRIVAFVQKVERMLAETGRELSVPFLKAVHLRTVRDMTRARELALDGYRDPSEKKKSGTESRREKRQEEQG
jgi:hypothetical protein